MARRCAPSPGTVPTSSTRGEIAQAIAEDMKKNDALLSI
jgi:hypothetical protein